MGIENFKERSERIAKDVPLEIIESEIEDWTKGRFELKDEIKMLQKKLEEADARLAVWVEAKKIKISGGLGF